VTLLDRRMVYWYLNQSTQKSIVQKLSTPLSRDCPHCLTPSVPASPPLKIVLLCLLVPASLATSYGSESEHGVISLPAPILPPRKAAFRKWIHKAHFGVGTSAP
jgi:hypothetical protein